MFETLSPRRRFAMELIAAGLNTHELAHAMSWSFGEAQTFRARLHAMLIADSQRESQRSTSKTTRV